MVDWSLITDIVAKTYEFELYWTGAKWLCTYDSEAADLPINTMADTPQEAVALAHAALFQQRPAAQEEE